MKIYRGPKTKDLVDDSHQLVDARAIGEAKPWTVATDVQVNISKDPKDRHAIATLRFFEADIVGLYEALVQGRKNQSAQLEAEKEENRFLRESLGRIKVLARNVKPYDKNESVSKTIGDMGEKLSKIIDVANDALGEDATPSHRS